MKKNRLIYIFMVSVAGLFGCKTEKKIVEEKTENGIQFVYVPKKTTYSGFQTIIIPKKTAVSYDQKDVNRFIDFLSNKFKNKEIIIKIDTVISFIDCGENFEKTYCPNCGKEIELETWQELMEKAYSTNFTDLRIQTNCCRTNTDLNSLKYKSDCGFSKSKIIIQDISLQKLEKEILLKSIDEICGIESKIIIANY